MDNLNQTFGLQVVKTTPSQGQGSVNIYKPIVIEFSDYLDPLTIQKNVRLYQSVGGEFTTIGKLDDLSLFVPIECESSYNDKLVTLKPNYKLNIDQKFILVVEAMTVSSITGKQLLANHVVAFSTEAIASTIPVESTFPVYGYVTKQFPTLTWRGDALSYTVQISKLKTFDVLIFDEQIQGTELIPSEMLLKLSEGIYFWRVKPESGEFTEPNAIFIKLQETMPVSHEDAQERIVGLPWENDVEVLEVFPEDGFSNVALNLKIMYIKLRGLYTAEDLDMSQTFVTGYVNDDMDMDTIKAHGDLNGEYTVVRDEKDDCTYIVFSIRKL